MGPLQRAPQTTPAALSQDCSRLRRHGRTSLVKNRMREIRTSGSVRGGDGNVPTYSAILHSGQWFVHVPANPRAFLRLASHNLDWLDDQTCVASFAWSTQQAGGVPVKLAVTLRHVLGHAGSSALPSVALTFEDEVL